MTAKKVIHLGYTAQCYPEIIHVSPKLFSESISLCINQCAVLLLSAHLCNLQHAASCTTLPLFTRSCLTAWGLLQLPIAPEMSVLHGYGWGRAGLP